MPDSGHRGGLTAPAGRYSGGWASSSSTLRFTSAKVTGSPAAWGGLEDVECYDLGCVRHAHCFSVPR